MILYIALALLILLLYWLGTKNFSYWTRQGVKHDKPVVFLGNHTRVFFIKISITDSFTEQYRRYPNERMVGYYFGPTKTIILRDPELIKQILVTDFAYFYPRGLNPSKDYIEPMLKNLFFADGDLWKLLRQRMTPAFTSGKLKAMFPLIVERAEQLQRIAGAAAACGAETDVRDLMARYTTDFIGACGFGIDANSLNDHDSTFRRLGKRAFTFTKIDGLRVICKFTMREMFKRMHLLAPEIERTTRQLVSSVMSQRNYKPCGRNDFIDLLLELREKGKIVGESIEHRNPDGTPHTAELELDELLMAAQVLVFFAAGFETSSSATSFTLHQLAFNPRVQTLCQAEIDQVLARYDDKLCYDAVREMKYLEMAFRESMRMFPSLGYVTRKCAKSYTIPDTNVTLEEGVLVVIPIQGLHMDEKYFVDPEEFRPERFAPEVVNDINKYVYLPFGDGPRSCIGERLGLMQSLAGLAAILHKFTVVPSRSSLRKPVPDPASTIVQSIKGGLPLSLVARKKVV